uniref:Immunoglobulin V-set domain-containing protein n=1 Tax=Sparus aurata TaxID=8175 RepID=A0A671XUY8_SPAAU
MFTFLLLSSAFVSGWISASVSQYQTVEAQHGEEVALQCNNISKFDTQTFWSRLVNRTKISCIVVMLSYGGEVTVSCDGYEKGKFEMKSNISTVFLNIKKVDSSDSGLYYCGFSIDGIPILTPIHLKSEGMAMLISVIPGALAGVFLLVIIGLVVQNRKLQTGTFSNLFYPTPVRERSAKEVETQVIYTASRQTQRSSELN